MRRWLALVLGVLAGIAAAEGFLGLVVSKTRAMGLWYDAGIHRRDDRFGFTFQGGYRGLMEHQDRVFHVPLELDEAGFRRPSESRASDAAEVVFVGGQSMMFGYGVRDAATIPWQVARDTRHEIRAWNAALPGFDVHRSWVAYRDDMAPRVRPKLVVLSIYRFGEARTEVPASIPPVSQEDQDALFRFHPSIVVSAAGPFATLMGPLAFRFQLANKLARFADAVVPRDRVATLARTLPPSWRPPRRTPPVSGPTMPLRSFLDRLRSVLESEGTAMMVAFLPRKRSNRELYAPLRPHVPEGMVVIDLHRALHEAGRARFPTLANGHYAPAASRAISRALAPEIDAVLDRALLAAPGARSEAP